MNSAPPSVLVVDDQPANLQLLTDMLHSRGYRVRPVPSGDLALQAARCEAPDLILLDISMPGMDGYEVCQRLKADPELRGIPVIFISALHGVIDKVKAFSVGGVDYVSKPFQCEEVEARMRTHLTLRHQERQLADKLAQLQELERLRDSLVHMIVHDMRNPLASIRMSLELQQLTRPPAPHELTRMTQLALVATTRLQEMTTQLLDISRLEAGQMPLQKEMHDLADTLRTTVQSLAALTGQRRVGLEMSEPAAAVYDQEIVGRVVANLLTNAFKFTPADGEIKLHIVRQPHFLRVEVVDSGKGIAPECHRKIFEKFGQAELRQKRIGTGLGLAFCKLAVEAHGGTIGVESQLGRGSTFWFTLPA